WVALRDGKCVGRISAQIDQLHLQRYADNTGFFGMLESVDDPAVFGALLGTAERWLSEQGMHRVRGPFNLTVNEECGLLVEGFDTPPSMMMGHARPYYADRLAQYGYIGAADTLAYIMPPQYEAPAVMRKLVAYVKKRTVVRDLRRDRLDEELAILRDVFNDAWSENWGFVPFTEAEFAEIGRAMLHLAHPDMVQIAEVEGRPAAMIVALPNLNEVIADMGGRLLPFNWARLLWRLKVRYPRTARVPLMGVRKEFQNTRMGPGLAFTLIDAEREVLARRGIEEVELSWILADNLGMRNIIESIGGVAYKRYRLFEKALG
ncbi:MAG: N-acetyltransferase, partial [Chromatiales bacterium]|nr:N-acetyltransferase [Chromatiales bacterium]